MERRSFGSTGLTVSAVGFGAWGIGGPAMAGSTPIGWGAVNDDTSRAALLRAHERGITFYDTADFYGLGHSEELIGEVLAERPDVVIATKVGHRMNDDSTIALDYSREHIIAACERSLRRLRRDRIDYYQLHSARLQHLQQGECLEAMERLREQGKIRFWGLSLNTFAPAPEAEYLMERKLGHGFQLVLNIINQRAVPLLAGMHAAGYGVIARMPLQFGLLTGKFGPEARFAHDDHRAFRLTPEVLAEAIPMLEKHVWPMASELGVSRSAFSLGFCLDFPEVSTVIPGIKTPQQVDLNAAPARIRPSHGQSLRQLFQGIGADLMSTLESRG